MDALASGADIRHFLDEEGYIPEDVPEPARRMAEYFGTIITHASAVITENEFHSAPIACRRRPGRKRCKGKIEVDFRYPDFAILWNCPVCGDEGIISGWEGTHWDLSPKSPESTA